MLLIIRAGSMCTHFRQFYLHSFMYKTNVTYNVCVIVKFVNDRQASRVMMHRHIYEVMSGCRKMKKRKNTLCEFGQFM